MDSGIVNSDGMPGFECDPPEPKQSHEDWLENYGHFYEMQYWEQKTKVEG